jgi:hypothetical protein
VDSGTEAHLYTAPFSQVAFGILAAGLIAPKGKIRKKKKKPEKSWRPI